MHMIWRSASSFVSSFVASFDAAAPVDSRGAEQMEGVGRDISGIGSGNGSSGGG